MDDSDYIAGVIPVTIHLHHRCGPLRHSSVLARLLEYSNLKSYPVFQR